VLRSRLAILLPVLLLLVYFGTRLHNLMALPLFLDEASHITRAQYVFEGRPFFLLETGKALAPYFAAVFYPYHAAPFLGRYVVILLGVIGIAAAYKVGTMLYPAHLYPSYKPQHAGLLTMLLWIASGQLFFFERMALVDTTISAMAMLSLMFALRMLREGRPRFAVFCGIALALTVFAKLTGIVFLSIPLLVALLDSPCGWRVRVRQMAITYTVFAAIMVLPFLHVTNSESDPTGQEYGLTSTRVDTLPERLTRNINRAWQAEQIYHSPVMFAVMIGSWIVGLAYFRRSAMLLIFLVIIPFAAIVSTAQSLWLRYLSPLTPFLLMLMAISLLVLADQLPGRLRALKFAPYVVPLVWAFAAGIPFMQTAYTDPARLQLPVGDLREYIWWIPSGYGMRDAAFWLMENTTTPTTVIGTAVSCHSARLYTPPDSLVKYSCPSMDWSGNNPHVVQEMRDRLRNGERVLVLAEEKAPPTVPVRLFPGREIELVSFARPLRSRNTVRIYVLYP
jgi:4-amino-4-deoxy-L-arabinose transferase-like glycosyltransferase